MAGLEGCKLLPTDPTELPLEVKSAPVPAEKETVVTILLERSFIGTHAGKIGLLIRELRVLAMQQPGYVAGQTYLGENDPDYFLVTNTRETWQSLEHWQAWYDHPDRQKLEAQVDGLLEAPTRVQVFT